MERTSTIKAIETVVIDHTNALRLEGGSICVSRYFPKDVRFEDVKVETFCNGRVVVKDGLRNVTSEAICLKRGYETVACGRADEITVGPGEVIVMVYKGDARAFTDYLVWDGKTPSTLGRVSHACPDCGKVVGTWDEEYACNYPNGFDMAVEQAMTRHRSGECPESSEWDTVEVCPHCGEEIGRWDYEYVSRNPNGSDMAISRAREQHEEECPVLVAQEWEEWRTAAKAKEEETPRQLLARRYSEGMRMALYKIPCPPDREQGYYDVWIEEIREFIKERMNS